jgi:hypothetical protein
LGELRQRVGKAFILVLDVKDIAMAWRIAPGGSPMLQIKISV